MWVYCAGKIGSLANILFEYQPTRKEEHAVAFLGIWNGLLACDGYGGYNKLTQVTQCGCWAHVRRKFMEALPSSKDKLPESQAVVGMEYCNRLFRMERKFAEFSQ